MKIKKTFGIIVLCFLGIIGCSSKPQAECKIEKRYITIITEPEGATVQQINPQGLPVTNLGVTPIIEQPVMVVTDIIKMKNLPQSESLNMTRRANGGVSVVIRKDGYQKYSGILKTESGKTLTHKITLQTIEK